VIVVGLFGIINIVGGIIGFLKVKSKVSLISGVSSGIVLLICADGIYNGDNIAAIASIVIAVLLGGRFISTIIKKFKIMPDLIVVIFSFLTIVLIGSSLL
jgi:uncharacterized membrane protein (UPF0136 family)